VQHLKILSHLNHFSIHKDNHLLKLHQFNKSIFLIKESIF